ncbi:MAG: bifunctional hydroxymethylpyrimidine kinase/phosphomethylpyrimidine kinase [Verrucomicrobiales bacterium]|nr:bifunctional hydroxymethylpyrimidine kinase/phosphomethylpyrimidine kinase [Verrucomicrobiales bacterium]
MLPCSQSKSIALSIAGSDPSGGAGIQADIKTFHSFGVHGLTAITCVTSQVPGKVINIEPVSVNALKTQIDTLFSEYKISAIKTGLLVSSDLIEVLISSLDNGRIDAPLVVDPVMISTSGTKLLNVDALSLYIEELIPRSTLYTPNLSEAATLLGIESKDVNDPAECANLLYQKYGSSVLLKGGHFKSTMATDFLVDESGIKSFSKPFSEKIPAHGTGCTYSASICACIAKGLNLHDSILKSKNYISKSIDRSFELTSGHFTLNHDTDGSKPPQ